MNKNLIIILILSIFNIYANSISINNKFDMPIAIQTFVNATNSGDSQSFVANFTEDAYLRDWFYTFKGQEGVNIWNKSDNIGKNTHFDVLSIFKGKTDDEYILKVKVSGNGFNGNSKIQFFLKDNFISKMIILPW